MWDSPINITEIQDSFVSEIKNRTEEMVFTEIKRIGIDVDKEELIKALTYDRNQYEKGYADGYAEAIREFSGKLIDLANEFPTVENDDGEIRPMTIEEMCNQVARQLKVGGRDD